MSGKVYKLSNWFAPADRRLEPGETLHDVWDELVRSCTKVAERAQAEFPWSDDGWKVVIVRFGECGGRAWVLGQIAFAADSAAATFALAAGKEDDPQWSSSVTDATAPAAV